MYIFMYIYMYNIALSRPLHGPPKSANRYSTIFIYATLVSFVYKTRTLFPFVHLYGLFPYMAQSEEHKRVLRPSCQNDVPEDRYGPLVSIAKALTALF